MDYPPDWMLLRPNLTLPLSNVDPAHYPDLARYYLLYAQHFHQAAGFPLRYISLFNEPHDSYTYITVPEIADLLVNHVGPLFRLASKQDPSLPGLTYATQADRNTTFYRTPQVLAIPGVVDYTSVLMYHGYDCAPWVCSGNNNTCPQLDWSTSLIANLTARYAHLNVSWWMSEVCYAQEYGNWNGPPACPALPFAAFQDALQWFRMMVADFRAGASAWIYWNMVLNPQGGPHMTSPEHNDPAVDIQQPLIIVDPATDSFSLTGAYYAMAHFGRYVERGAVMVESSGGEPNLPHVAFFHRQNRTLVVQLANDFASARSVVLYISGRDAGCVHFLAPPVSIVTVILDDFSF